MRKKIYLIMFLIYAGLLVRLTIYRNAGEPVYAYPHANLILFGNLLFVKSNSLEVFLYLLIGNIICFMPLGYFIKEFAGSGMLKSIFICILISLSIETVQYILMVGVFELDDIILNTTGALLGIILWYFAEYLGKRRT